MKDNGNRKSSLPLQLLKLLAAFAIAWLIVVFIFCTVTPTGFDGGLKAKYNLPVTLIAIVLAFATNMIIDYNAIQRLKSLITKTKADIVSVNETSSSLIDKAERVVEKYLQSETGVYSKFAEARKESPKLKNSNDFRVIIEAYPELKANVHTQKLLNQLEVSENAKLNARTTYSSAVAKYNTKIHTFPIVLLRKLCKWEDINTQIGVLKEELITDEELMCPQLPYQFFVEKAAGFHSSIRC